MDVTGNPRQIERPSIRDGRSKLVSNARRRDRQRFIEADAHFVATIFYVRGCEAFGWNLRDRDAKNQLYSCDRDPDVV